MPANTFPANSYRFDPYQNFRFQVFFQDISKGSPGTQTLVAAVSRVTGLSRTTQVTTYREGNNPGVIRRIPGQTQYGPITLERGVTHAVEFEQWANKVWDYQNSTAANGTQVVSLADFRKNVTIKLLNEAGQVVLVWNVYRCWVSDYKPLSDLDGSASAILIESITIENEGWQKDQTVTSPAQPVVAASPAKPF